MNITKKDNNNYMVLLNDNRGFTLVELMVSTVISMMIVAAATTVFNVQKRLFTTQDQTVELQSTAKITTDLMERDIREAGFGGLPDGQYSINGNSAPINIVNNVQPKLYPSGLTSDPEDTVPSDALVLLGGFELMGTTVNATIMGSNTVEIEYESSVEFNISDKKYISFSGIQMSEIASITSTSPVILTLTDPFSKTFPQNTPIYLVEDLTYERERLEDSGRDVLRRISRIGKPQKKITIAENIEDMQFGCLPVTTPPCSVSSDITSISTYILSRSASASPSYKGKGRKNDIVADLNDDTDDDIDDVYASEEETDGYKRRLWSKRIDLQQ